MTPKQILEKTTKIACQDGNWNYSEYSLGFANGLLTACTIILEGNDKQLLKSPKKFLKDK